VEELIAETEEHYKRAIELQPSNLSARMMVGHFHTRLGIYYRQANEIYYGFVDSICREQKNGAKSREEFKKAEEYYSILININPHPEFFQHFQMAQSGAQDLNSTRFLGIFNKYS
jgi:tetratricopeptide (TPR) repeat protein